MGNPESPQKSKSSKINFKEEDTGFMSVLYSIYRIAVPTMISCFFMQLIYTINTMYAGRLGDAHKIAGLGLGTSFLECVTLCTLIGMNGAVETLVSHAFGAGHMQLCGAYLNRGRVINTAIFVPLALILCFSKPMLIAMGQDPMVAQYAQTYIVVNLPGVYFMGQFDLAKRFLNCLRITWVPMVAQVGSTFLHLACCEIIVVRMGVQPIIGLGLASTVTSVSLFIMITIYANMIDNIKESIYWPDSSVWLGWKEYFALGVPTTGIMCAEYWAWQGLCIMSGNLSVNEQAIMMITVQIAWLVNTTCLGLQEAACVLVGI